MVAKKMREHSLRN